MIITSRTGGDPGPDGCLGPILLFGPLIALIVIVAGVIDVLPDDSLWSVILAVLALIGSFGTFPVGAWLYTKWATGEQQRERIENLARELLEQNITTVGPEAGEGEQESRPGIPGLEGLRPEQTDAVAALLRTTLQEAFERSERRSVRIQLAFFAAGLIFATPANLLVIKLFQ